MATLKNVTINDTGYVRVPQGTSAQRPSTPTVTLSAAFLSPLGISRDGLQLYITSTTPSVAGNTWQHYQNLPDYLKNLQTTRGINETDGANITFSDATVVYMLRVPTWNAVDTTGWTTVETAKQYIGGETNVSVFSKTFSAGTYSFDNNSAMYMFSPVTAGTTTSVGAMRFNTTYGINEVWTGSEWKSLSGKTVSATGGNTIEGAVTVGGYKIHTFTANGTFTPTYSGTVDLLLVGGGGGGSGLSGGGGGGGFIYLSNYQVSGGVPYPITIGSGGSGATSHTNGTMTAGNPSTFNGTGPQGIQAIGGGSGGWWYGNANPGGSGGGGPGYNYSPGQRPAGNGTYGQGHPGGYGHHGGGPASNLSPQPGICIYGGGGGGGAGHKGHERKSWGAEAKGGDGLGNSIYTEKTAYYAGGGAGGSHGPSGNYGRDRSVGGTGGGGGSYSGGPQTFMDARPGSGGGGGGAWHPDTYRSGNGGSGIVIVRYRT